MKITDMVAQVNRLAGHGSYTLTNLLGYFDECIDEINADLNIALPSVTEVYENNFDLLETEVAEDYSAKDADNVYGRLPDSYIRNYVCYETIYRLMRDEDEDYESYAPKQSHANRWYTKLLGAFSDYTLEDTESITINGDVDDIEQIDDTGVGFYNPLDPLDQS